MKICSLLKLCVFLPVLMLSSCSRPYDYWEDTCRECHTKKKNCSFGFVPLYTDEELNQPFSLKAVDSQEEQNYKSASTPTFRNITFETDSYSIKGEENLSILTTLVHHMKKSPKVTLYIEGHTDERGAASYNLALGSRRANAVKNYLIKQGISAERLFTISYGKEHPRNPGHDELAWQQNRRTEFKIYAR
ncbi:OmpA family protein [Chlamydia pecorum]|uniref:Peptidoglycan-associated lipoprotein n=1 Tax=Chlamydia pecorum (strain ATCC VR-628 / DSM 29919 / E58) TaxID=331635 RepID=A0AA34RCQ4_CHLPE|nr:OmpA family protein [Chlamydia pecorum]AEB41271.1 peptidoglycan-associated lipoprotein [Chlamydia pecorum E58]UFP06846.1 OmpA family protein [Chlamydia pecorum]UJT76652.1 peptidoglycan-associated lipoprotein [Chlamydia pecorum]